MPEGFICPTQDRLPSRCHSGHELLSFMYAYLEYKQNKVVEGDTQHTTLYTDSDIYHYSNAFGVNKCRRHLSKDDQEIIRRDDMLVKSVKGIYYVEKLKKIFECMRLHQVRLNPAKCAFNAQSNRFLGYMVIQRGIEVNREKMEAIQGMEVQRLNGRLAALTCFLAKSGDKSLQFF